MLPRAVLTSTLIALATFAQSPPRRPLVEWTDSDLAGVVPGWSALQRSPADANLAPVLKSVGAKLDASYAAYADVRFRESVEETRIEDSTLHLAHRAEHFLYTARILPGSDLGLLEEHRRVPGSDMPVPAARNDGFLLATALVEPVAALLTPNQPHFRFRALGVTSAGALLVAFSPLDTGALQSHLQLRRDAAPPALEGLAWVEVQSNRVSRIRLILAGADASMQTASIDTAYAPVRFDAIGAELFLPVHAVAEAHFRGGLVHTAHRFSEYHLDGIDEADDPAQARRNSGELTAHFEPADDTIALLAKGSDLCAAKQPADALAPLRTVVVRRPELAAAHYILAYALRDSGDKAAAEREFQAALSLAENSASLHNELGMLLFARGDFALSRTHFARAVQLLPSDAALHFNLARVLEKLKQNDNALSEYRAALAIEPDNALTKQYIETIEAAAQAQTTIHVDVKQVVVPVVATNHDGVTVKDLIAADFHVFEDGVEQTVTAFTAEHGEPALPPTTASASPTGAATPAVPAKATPARRSYLIVVDMFNTEITDVMGARQALRQLFAEERAGDANYTVVSLGRSINVIQETTRDPAVVAASIGGGAFQKQILNSVASQRRAEMRNFRRELDDALAACNSKDPSCPALKMSARSNARSIGTEQRVVTLAYLRQLRAIVEQFGHAGSRRVLVLLSGGFSATPARGPQELLYTYFPDMIDARLEGIERMQDELDSVYRAAARANVPIYTVDARGLYTSDAMSAENGGGNVQKLGEVIRTLDNMQRDAGFTLMEMAAATGGTAYQNTNDLKGAFKKALDEGREYYQLAYTSSNAALNGKYRKIRVEVARKGVAIKAKQGYWADSEPNTKH